ncbi:Phospholipid methyltransferase [uncultured archaeon]|nr:Phospholipid methyltransferase [uncultured archaeon]
MTGFKSVQHKWDKVFLYLIQLLFFAWLIIMPLDAVRFHLSHMPEWFQIVGAFVLLSSFYLFYRTFRENPYLSPGVRTQEDRGQTVVTTGPYHYVRHPMYSGFVLFVLGTTLLLGSWYGLILGFILVITAALAGSNGGTHLKEGTERLRGIYGHGGISSHPLSMVR